MNVKTESSMPSYSDFPDSNGHFGQYGGRYVSETLMAAVNELEAIYKN